MTFYTETRFSKQFYIDDTGDPFELDANYRVYWVFTFANKDTEKIEGTILGDGVTFDIPNQFFTVERRGALTHRLLLIDSDANPILYTKERKDILTSAGPTLTELNL